MKRWTVFILLSLALTGSLLAQAGQQSELRFSLEVHEGRGSFEVFAATGDSAVVPPLDDLTLAVYGKDGRLLISSQDGKSELLPESLRPDYAFMWAVGGSFIFMIVGLISLLLASNKRKENGLRDWHGGVRSKATIPVVFQVTDHGSNGAAVTTSDSSV